MTLSQALARRVANHGTRDPDTLHGRLCLIERGVDENGIVALLGAEAIPTYTRLDKARLGQAGRIPPVNAGSNEKVEDLAGILRKQWKRDLALLLLAGACTSEVAASIHGNGYEADPGEAVATVRDDLKPLRVSIEAVTASGARGYRYSITGRSAWRLQNIIANGWSL